MLAGCDQQAQKASSDAIPDAGSAKSGGVAVITEWKTTDQTGRIVIPPQFDEAGSFSDGLAAVRIGARFGYIDKQGPFRLHRQARQNRHQAPVRFRRLVLRRAGRRRHRQQNRLHRQTGHVRHYAAV